MCCEKCNAILSIKEERENPKTYVRWEERDEVVRETGRYIRTHCEKCDLDEQDSGAQRIW